MTMSSSLEERLHAAITQYYPVLPLKSLSPLHYPQFHTVDEPDSHQSIWLVETATEKFCFKKHRAHKSVLRIKAEELWHCCMNESDVLPDLVVTAAGQTGVSLGPTGSWYLEKWHPPSHYIWWRGGWDKDFCRRGGELLGRFHSATVGTFRTAGIEGMGCPIEPADVLAGLVNRCADFPSHRDLMRELGRLAGKTLSGWVDCGREELLLVHGDFHPGNTLRDCSLVVDVEHVHADLAEFDVGYALAMFCTDWQEKKGLLKPLVTAFMSGYRSNAPGPVVPESIVQYTLIGFALIADWLIETVPPSFIEKPALSAEQKHALLCLMKAWSQAVPAK